MKLTNLSNDPRLATYKVQDQFAMDVFNGLISSPKRIPSKYFYDDIGSQLFQRITQQKDYYLTRVEQSILQQAQSRLPQIIGESEIDIVELGAGDGHKTKIIIDGFLAAGCRVNFYPIDISEEAMTLLSKNISETQFLNIHGVVAEYREGLKYIRDQSKNRQLVLFLGSNIGNFERSAGYSFFRMIWLALGEGDYLFSGFDLKKDIDILNRAYNDSAGVTNDFNLNLLKRINNELDANFEIKNFRHLGVYNPVLGAMESFLISLVNQEVKIKKLEKLFSFQKQEPIHLEYSFKFSPEEIKHIGTETGFEICANFTDTQNYFIDSLWKTKKESMMG